MTTHTGIAYGAAAALYYKESRSTYAELAASSAFVKWSRPDRYVRVPVVTVSASTEDSSLILVGLPAVRRGHPERGITIDFDVYRRHDALVTHHTGFTDEMRALLASTGTIRSIGELNRLALHGGYGGLDRQGHIRAHHSTGVPTGDPLADLWVAASMTKASRTRP